LPFRSKAELTTPVCIATRQRVPERNSVNNESKGEQGKIKELALHTVQLSKMTHCSLEPMPKVVELMDPQPHEVPSERIEP
jgi:hypothetical protein